MVTFRRVNEENEEKELSPMEQIARHLEETLQKYFGGENEGEYDEGFYYVVRIPINIKSEFVNIKYFDIRAGIYPDRIWFRGCAKPNPDLLSPELTEVVKDPGEFKQFEEDIYFNGKSISEVNREIDQVVKRFFADEEKTIALWDFMQESLDKADELKREIWQLQKSVEKRLA